tara:strand:- start:2445 stop:4841 length:2397 start_codon:yes stop_codon:yes gene_type:complete
MKLPLNWLKEYVTYNISPEEIAENLTIIGLEVESISEIGMIAGVIVGEIQKISKHPNADTLKIVIVFDGTNKYKIICGAPNICVGQKIFFATPGTKLPDENSPEKFYLIKESKIRGELSQGMICSEKELGLGENHDGIMVLPKDFKLGDPISKYYGEIVMELDITPNRVDCLSITGIARDLSARIDKEFKFKYTNNHPNSKQYKNNIQILDENICSRYTGVIIDNISIAESPDWLKRRLISIGERPINNLVDITNYVMFEIGQPLHAFDLDKINEEKIYVRNSKKGEEIKTLDGNKRILDSHSIVIADNKSAIGLAGIMGGKNSEIDIKTNSIFLESANFNPSIIRNTSKLLSLQTGASIRFERNLNPELTIYGLSRALDLILEICGGKTRSGILDNYNNKVIRKTIILDKKRLCKILGLEIDNEIISKTLNSLNFSYDFDKLKDIWKVETPFWRSDITLPEDLYEEIARIVGYDSIPLKFISGEIPKWEPNKLFEYKNTLTDLLVGSGMYETISYSAISEEMLGILPDYVNNRKNISITNPISNEHAYLRKSLIPSIIMTASRNTNNWKKPIRIFETGNVFFQSDQKIQEQSYSAGLLTGVSENSHWDITPREVDYFDGKGIIDYLSSKLRFNYFLSPYNDAIYTKGKSVRIHDTKNETTFGYLGMISEDMIEKLNFNTSSVVIFELFLEELYKSSNDLVYKDFSQFPLAHRDLSLLIDTNVNFEDIKNIAFSEKFVIDCNVFDVYQGDNLPEGKIGIAVRIYYQSNEGTLSWKNLQQIEKKILIQFEKKLGIKIRE